MKKVLFVVSDANCHGGTETLALNILHRLSASGVYCRLLSKVPYKGDDPLVLSFAEKDIARWKRASKNPLDKFCGNALSDLVLRRLVLGVARDFGANWIINHTYDLCAAMPFAQGIKTAQVLHWSVVGYEVDFVGKYETLPKKLYGLPSLYARFRRWHKALLKFDKLIPLTKAGSEELMGVVKEITEDKLCIIPNPVMYSEDSAKVSSLCNKNIVYVGRLSHEKGVMRLLRMWKRLSPALPGYTLSVYGDGYAEREMKDYIKSNGLKGVRMMGYCSDKSEIYRNADLLLLTSKTEGFGLVIIEAMYYGVPCVSFDCLVSPKEIIADTGVVVPCFDEEKFVEAVVNLLGDEEKMRTLQSAAIERARGYYIDTIIDKWNKLISI